MVRADPLIDFSNERQRATVETNEYKVHNCSTVTTQVCKCHQKSLFYISFTHCSYHCTQLSVLWRSSSGKESFSSLWTQNCQHYSEDCLELFLFREDCHVFAREACMFSVPFSDIFENCFVMFLQINELLFSKMCVAIAIFSCNQTVPSSCET